MSRTPHGVRGLKQIAHNLNVPRTKSHPTRGAWIETCWASTGAASTARRTPHGVRGLKRYAVALVDGIGMSHPTRGAWIETVSDQYSCRPT